MKCFCNYYGIVIFISFLCFSSIISAKPNKSKSKKTKKSLISNPNHLAIAHLLRKMGSKQTIQKLVKKLDKKCKNLRILERTQTTLKNLRSKHGFIRTALKKNTVPTPIRSTLYHKFFKKLFSRLLKCSVVSSSKVAWQLKKANKLIKKGKKINSPLSSIRKLVKVTNAKAKKQQGFFAAVRKYYRFLSRKRMIKKILNSKIPNPIKKNKKSLSKANTKIAKISNLGKKIKLHLKKCVLFKGKFAKKACKKVKEIRSKMRIMGNKLYRKLKRTCKRAKTHCIHKGNKKFCRKAHKLCNKVKKLGKKISNSKRLSNATSFAKILSKIISGYIVKY